MNTHNICFEWWLRNNHKFKLKYLLIWTPGSIMPFSQLTDIDIFSNEKHINSHCSKQILTDNKHGMAHLQLFACWVIFMLLLSSADIFKINFFGIPQKMSNSEIGSRCCQSWSWSNLKLLAKIVCEYDHWSGNTTITNCRQAHGTARKSHTIITRQRLSTRRQMTKVTASKERVKI